MELGLVGIIKDQLELIKDQVLNKDQIPNKDKNPLRQQQMGRPGGGGKGPNPNNKKPNRISNPNTKKIKNSKWMKALKYGLYAASAAIIAIFFLCVFWIYQHLHLIQKY